MHAAAARETWPKCSSAGGAEPRAAPLLEMCSVTRMPGTARPALLHAWPQDLLRAHAPAINSCRLPALPARRWRSLLSQCPAPARPARTFIRVCPGCSPSSWCRPSLKLWQTSSSYSYWLVPPAQQCKNRPARIHTNLLPLPSSACLKRGQSRETAGTCTAIVARPFTTLHPTATQASSWRMQTVAASRLLGAPHAARGSAQGPSNQPTLPISGNLDPAHLPHHQRRRRPPQRLLAPPAEPGESKEGMPPACWAPLR